MINLRWFKAILVAGLKNLALIERVSKLEPGAQYVASVNATLSPDQVERLWKVFVEFGIKAFIVDHGIRVEPFPEAESYLLTVPKSFRPDQIAQVERSAKFILPDKRVVVVSRDMELRGLLDCGHPVECDGMDLEGKGCGWCADIKDMAVLTDHLSRTYGHFSNDRITTPTVDPDRVFEVAAELEQERIDEAVKDELAMRDES